jgi:hypothetical protein
MTKHGRKPIKARDLIFWEQHWWQVFLKMRDGLKGGEEVDAVWATPEDWSYPVRPEWMCDTGATHEWERKVREEIHSHFGYKIHVSKGSPGEPNLWEALKRARTARRVRTICNRSRYRHELTALYERAEVFVRALAMDSRYPRKARAKDNRRLLHCAQVMAGISCRVPPATAVDKLRKLKHGKLRRCNCADCSNIKALRLQLILIAYSDWTRADSIVKNWLPLEALAGLDEKCKCTHCSLVASVSRKPENGDGVEH